MIDTTSRWRKRGLLLWLVGALFLAAAGCAGSRGAAPRPPVPTDERLPGAGRALPSEQNPVAPSAPSAFPDYPYEARAGAGAGPATSGAPQTPAATEASGSPGGREAAREGSIPVPATPARPPAVTPAETFYTVQIEALTSAERARALQNALGSTLGAPARVDREDDLYKVRVGMFPREAAAESVRREAVARGHVDARIVTVEGRDGGGVR